MKPKPITPDDIKRARIVAGHTQREAAAVLGVALRTWQYWEKGQTTMRPEQLRLYRLATLGEARADADRARLEKAFLGPPD